MIELNKIYNEDCLEGMKKIDDGSVDMILCDLPYGTTACKWDTVIPFDKLWEQYKRIIKPNGAIVLMAVQPFTSLLVTSNLKLYRESLVWQKHKPSNFACGKTMHLKYHEDIIVFAINKPVYNPQMQPRLSNRIEQMQRGKSKKWNTVRTDGNEISFKTQYEPKAWSEYDSNTKYPSSIIVIPAVSSNSKEKCNHPTQKPVALFEYLIRTYTNEGDLVFDGCTGSATTPVACIRTNRNFIGFELDKNYFDIGNERIRNENKNNIMLHK